jgi:hypothetical protein
MRVLQQLLVRGQMGAGDAIPAEILRNGGGGRPVQSP